MSPAQDIEHAIQNVLANLKASQSLTDQYGNKIARLQAIGDHLIQIEFSHNQKPVIEHVTQFKCFIAN